jgi:hypothetical protein
MIRWGVLLLFLAGVCGVAMDGSWRRERSSSIEWTGDDPPVELGRVRWGRDLDQAKKLASTSGKPILILFQEVPG